LIWIQLNQSNHLFIALCSRFRENNLEIFSCEEHSLMFGVLKKKVKDIQIQYSDQYNLLDNIIN